MQKPIPPARVLTPRQDRAVRYFITRVLAEVPAALEEAALFGSRARGEARPDSDVDVLLVFRSLPPDREPQATYAETIAEEVAAETAVPVTAWSISLIDLREGRRTPMLVDALTDSLPLWFRTNPLRPVPFTPPDALRCGEALVRRVAEGSHQFVAALTEAHWEAAYRRGRDDVVRMCTAVLLLHGITRPRRADAVHAAVHLAYSAPGPPRDVAAIFEWARRSFGDCGRDENGRIPPPPGGYEQLAAAIDDLRNRVFATARSLEQRCRH